MTHLELNVSDLTAPSFLGKGDKILASDKIVGQETALKALRGALELSAPKSHLFCVGPKGVGRTGITLKILNEYAQKHHLKEDWVYVSDLTGSFLPCALALPVGQGYAFSLQLSQSVQCLKQNLKKIFHHHSYLDKVQEIEDFFQQKKEHFLEELKGYFLSKGIALVQSGTGYGLCPVVDDQILGADEFNALPVKTRQKLLPQLEKAKKELADFVEKLFDFDDEKNTTLVKITQLFLSHQIETAFQPLTKSFKNQKSVQTYLTLVRAFLLEHASLLYETPDSEKVWDYLKVNPFLCHQTTALPVVHPSQIDVPSLLGDFIQEPSHNHLLYQKLSAGLLYQANGGFLVLDAKELLLQKELFYALKQVLFSQKISFKNAFVPEIPLDVRVVLIGSRAVYEELKAKDEDFDELFKMLVPFEEQMPRTKTSEKQYLGELMYFAQENQLKSFSLSACQVLLDEASRLAPHPKRSLSLHFGKIHDLMRLANEVACQTKARQVEAPHIQQVLSDKKEREGLPQKQWLQTLAAGLLRLNVKGTQVGSVHTLSVCATEDHKFGRVARLACTTCAGTGQIMDIEGQITFGGPVHAKGILILQNYLKARFGQREALKLDASLSFEQSYGPIDGDSASCAELCALMSAIGYIPLSQEIALTGSVNIYGQVGAVAGINEKIEGFFDVCQVLGSQKTQGVIFPKVCVKELLLKPEVIQAVKEKRFHLYAVDTIEECMEILSGLKQKAIDEKISTAWHHAFLNAKK